MLYRIALKTNNGVFYYLTSDNDNPETDTEIAADTIEFLSKIYPTHAHTFSTEKLAKIFLETLPYPYNEKAFIMKASSKEEPVVNRIYYRIAQFRLEKIIYISKDKKFTNKIEPQTASFSNLNDAKNFFNSLPKLTKKISCISEVHDFGPPKYEFKDYFITSTEEKSEEFQMNVIYS